MRKRTRVALYVLFGIANLSIAAAKATASDLVHTAAWDPAQGKWIVVCTQCVLSCNCSESET